MCCWENGIERLINILTQCAMKCFTGYSVYLQYAQPKEAILCMTLKSYLLNVN